VANAARVPFTCVKLSRLRPRPDPKYDPSEGRSVACLLALGLLFACIFLTHFEEVAALNARKEVRAAYSTGCCHGACQSRGRERCTRTRKTGRQRLTVLLLLVSCCGARGQTNISEVRLGALFPMFHTARQNHGMDSAGVRRFASFLLAVNEMCVPPRLATSRYASRTLASF
jgi:hypothetical protein